MCLKTGDKSHEYHKMLKIAIILHHQKVKTWLIKQQPKGIIKL